MRNVINHIVNMREVDQSDGQLPWGTGTNSQHALLAVCQLLTVNMRQNIKHMNDRRKANKHWNVQRVSLCWQRHWVGNTPVMGMDVRSILPEVCSSFSRKLTEDNLVFDQTLCSYPKQVSFWYRIWWQTYYSEWDRMVRHNNTNFEMDVDIRAAAVWSSVSKGRFSSWYAGTPPGSLLRLRPCLLRRSSPSYTQHNRELEDEWGGRRSRWSGSVQGSVPAAPRPWGSPPALWLLFSGSWTRSCLSRHHQTAGKLSGSPLWNPSQPEIREEKVLSRISRV